MSTSDLIQEVTQSLLAIMVTAGAGYALVFIPNAPNAPITTALGLVLGWYFTKSTVSAVNQQAATQQAATTTTVNDLLGAIHANQEVLTRFLETDKSAQRAS